MNNVIVIKEFVRDQIFGVFDMSSEVEYFTLKFQEADHLCTSLKEAIRVSQHIEHEYGPVFILSED